MIGTGALAIFLPSIPVALASAVCGVSKEAGSSVKFRPPAYVFAMLWPVLLLLLGIALCKAEIKWPIVLLSMALGSWVLIYSSNCGARKKQASWALAANLWLALIVMGCSSREGNVFNICVSSAFIAWLTFALLMNVTEVQQEAPPR